MCSSILSECVYVTMCASWIPWKWGHRSFESPRGYWGSNLGPLQEQQVHLWVCVCVGVCAFECRCPWNSEEGTRPPRDGVTGRGEPLDMGTGKKSQFFCKNSTLS